MVETNRTLFMRFQELDFRMKGRHASAPESWKSDSGNVADVSGNTADKRLTSAQIVAGLLNTSPRKVEQFRTVVDHGYQHDIESFREGRIDLREALELAMARKKYRNRLATDTNRSQTQLVPLLQVIKEGLETIPSSKDGFSFERIVQVALVHKAYITFLHKAGWLSKSEAEELYSLWNQVCARKRRV